MRRFLGTKVFNSFPFVYHEKINIVIDSLANNGMGIGSVNLKDGSNWRVFIPFTVPGDECIVKIHKNHGSYSEGTIDEMLIESPDRVKPRCSYFAQCGGCQYQMLSMKKQLEWKRTHVFDSFHRIGGFDKLSLTVNEAIGDANVFNYRSKITPHLEYNKIRSELKIGFQDIDARRSLVDIKACELATSAVQSGFEELRKNKLHVMNTSGQKIKPKYKIIKEPLLVRESVDETGSSAVTEQNITAKAIILNFKFEFKAGDFFQNNYFLLPKMVSYVLNKAVGSNLNKCKYLLDVYCGSGLFSICGSREFDRVLGVEISTAAISYAKRNCKLNNISNTEFISGDAHRIFNNTGAFPMKETCVIIDPPRDGCSESFLKQLLQLQPQRIVYVSCDPSTQARDSRLLMSSNLYRLVDIQPFDMFPQTRHIETVATFEMM